MRIPLLPFVLAALCVAGWAQPARAQFDVEVAFPNLVFTRPVDLQHAGDGSDRLFVVEQPGMIRVFANDPSVAAAAVFLDITDRVRTAGGEEGLLGLAFHPDYDANGFFYVYYSASNPRRSVVARYRVDPADPDRADPGSEAVILEVEQPQSNHNGGQIAFGPDGYLYVALGDGGGAGDPGDHGQDPTTLLGALLRLDVDHPSGGRAYGIPADNLFAGNAAGFREEIYAYGLRNPWRFSFDAETERLWLADVGQNAFEEIDLIENGGNYGWNTMEGFHCFSPPSGCEQDGLTLPVWEYPHVGERSITGGFVYRGGNVPELAGRYVYADFITGQIWALAYDGAQVTDNTELINTNLFISTFGVDQHRELYFGAFDGRVYRFVPTTGTATEPAETPVASFLLHPNHPNPFRDATTIRYTLAIPAAVELAVYDVRGRRVWTRADGVQPAGAHEVVWEGRDAQGVPLPGGVYLYQLRVDGLPVASRRMVRVR